MDPKELQVAQAIEEFRREHLTGKIELDFKEGKLVSGRKQVGLFN